MPSTPITSRIDGPLLERDDEQRRRVINRLKRLEGQVRGLQHMLEQGRSCREILTLLAGVRSALDATADVILEHYVETCVAAAPDDETALKDLIQAVKLARG
jgi:CsoR family transcriptional regulator, copper-sensing transcriptional repressor